MTQAVTRHQRKVLDHLSKSAAFSREKARAVPGFVLRAFRVKELHETINGMPQGTP